MNFCIDTLKLRAGCDKVNDSNDLCEKHYNDFIHFFTIRYNKCCDPFEIHCNKVTKKRKKVNKGKSLKVITYDFAKKHSLIPGARICKDCYTKANKSQSNINISFESESNISPFDESEVSRSRDTLNITLDESLEENEANLSTVDKISGKHT